MQCIHKKIFENHYEEIIKRERNFELRKLEDGYKKGDIVFLDEIKKDTKEKTGRSLMTKITDVFDVSDVVPGFCIWTFVILPLLD